MAASIPACACTLCSRPSRSATRPHVSESRAPTHCSCAPSSLRSDSCHAASPCAVAGGEGGGGGSARCLTVRRPFSRRASPAASAAVRPGDGATRVRFAPSVLASATPPPPPPPPHAAQGEAGASFGLHSAEVAAWLGLG